MGQRRENRGLAPRTDRQVLDNAHTMALLAAVSRGQVTRAGNGATAAFMLDDTPVQLKSLAREDLVFAPIGGLPTLAPRGRRLMAVEQGLEAAPPPD